MGSGYRGKNTPEEDTEGVGIVLCIIAVMIVATLYYFAVKENAPTEQVVCAKVVK